MTTPTTDPRLAAVLAGIFSNPDRLPPPEGPIDWEPGRMTDRQADRMYAAEADHAAERACAY